MKIPGFIDSHLHFLGLGYIQSNADLTSIDSIDALIETLSKANDKDLIIGRGFNQEMFSEKRLPTKADLNRVSQDIPIMIIRVCGHLIIVNDKMLELAKIDKSSEQIEGGTFSYETGIFTEKALGIIYDKIPTPSKEDIKSYFVKANQICLENGITSVASDDFSTMSVDYELIIQCLKELYEENKIQVKLVEQVNLPYDKLQDFINKGYANKDFGKFRMGPLKILGDGSLGARTAYLKKPYSDDENNFGIRTFTDTELFELIHLADKNNMDSVIHAIGDGAIEQAIKALKKSISLTKRLNHNHAIIHAQLMTKAQIEEMAKYNIGSIIQPIFLNSDIPIIEKRIGKRAFESYLFYTMKLSGLRVGFSTDAPVEPVNPFLNIYSSVTRKSIKHHDLQAFLPSEAYSIKEALQAYTLGNLPFIYINKLPEKDYIIVDNDILDIEPEKIKDIQVLETYIDNFLVYKKKY